MRKFFSKCAARLQHAWIGHPDCVLFLGYGIGDDWLGTAVAHELKQRGAKKIVMFSRHPSLFQGSPDVSKVYNWGYAIVGRLQHYGYNCRILHYGGYDADKDKDLYGD